MKKKLQIFVSSTFNDLVEERQAAVQAILRIGHIPAGMELFSAGNKSQLDTIKTWIEESDVYLLILGSRYGSLEPISGISYTEIEYQYAVELGKPFFALVLSDKLVESKVKIEGSAIIETDNASKYKKFKQEVLSKVCRLCNNQDEIRLAVLESISDIIDQFELKGWVKGDEIPDTSMLLEEIRVLRTERDLLKDEVLALGTQLKRPNKNRNIGDYSYDEIKDVLSNKSLVLPALVSGKENDSTVSALKLFVSTSQFITSGISRTFSNSTEVYLVNKLVPILMNFQLVDRLHVKGTAAKIEYDKYVISSFGNKFLSIYEMERIKTLEKPATDYSRDSTHS